RDARSAAGAGARGGCRLKGRPGAAETPQSPIRAFTDAFQVRVRDDSGMSTADEMRPLRVVIVGGGVAAIETSLALRALAPGRVELTIVAPTPVFELKPAAVGEPFGVARVPRFDLSRVAADLGATLMPGTASAVEADERRLLV